MSIPFWTRGAGGAVTPVLQSESAECGLACVLMLARGFGHELTLPALRRRFPGSTRGTTLRQIVGMLTTLGIGARPLRIETEHLAELKTPCILHWDMNHFVVLQHAGRRHLTVLDPARGRVRISLAEAGRHFTGVAIEPYRLVDFKPVRDTERLRLRDVLRSFERPWRVLGTVLLLGLSVELLALLLPQFAQWVVDDVVASRDTALITQLGAGFGLIALLHAAFLLSRGWLVSWLGASFNNQWSVNTFRHLLRLPWSYFQKRSVGDVMTRFGAIQQIRFTLTSGFIDSLLNGALGVLILIVLAVYSPAVAAIVAGFFVCYCAGRWLSLQQLWAANDAQMTWVAKEQSLLVESVRGAQSIKMLGAEHDRVLRYANANAEVIRKNYFLERMNLGFSTGAQLLFNLQRIVLVWLAGRMVMAETLTAGMLVALLVYSEQFSSRAISLVDKLVELRMLRVHVDRLSDIALSEPEDEGIASGRMPSDDTIEIDGVGFRYSENDPWVFRGLSISIRSGESVAITGPSGVGKTTLARIVLGLTHPSEGAVRFGGFEPHELGLSRYRSQFAAVLQDDDLFAGSIADNIASFDAGATPERIQEAARHAAIHDEIAAMPMGYETLVGDMGSSLSGGQKQRVLVARALYRKPRALVLDEATSHLDARNEARINRAIAELGITRVIIAHREETIASADRRIVLGGEVASPAKAPLAAAC